MDVWASPVSPGSDYVCHIRLEAVVPHHFNGSPWLGACKGLVGECIASANCALGKSIVNRDDYYAEELTRNRFFPFKCR